MFNDGHDRSLSSMCVRAVLLWQRDPWDGKEMSSREWYVGSWGLITTNLWRWWWWLEVIALAPVPLSRVVLSLWGADAGSNMPCPACQETANVYVPSGILWGGYEMTLLAVDEKEYY